MLCNADDFQTVLIKDKVPISSQKLYKDYSDAIKCDYANMNIVLCKKCTLIFNKSFFETAQNRDHYSDTSYYFSLSFTPQSKEYQRNMAKKYVSF